MMRALVIGYGSIGARHARLLDALGVEVGCVTQNAECRFPRFSSIEEGVRTWNPERVVISNATADHARTLAQLMAAGYRGAALVEKPLYGSPEQAPPLDGIQAFVAYNLRFHPLVLRLREYLQGRRLYTASFHAGQYLPQWRPASDYRNSYSAKPEEGGGVLRDLSHELDLATWLCGSWRRLSALGGQFSDLEIRSDDSYSILAAGERCPAVALSINYLDRMPSRSICLNGEGFTAALNLIAGTLSINGETIAQQIERDATYTAQLRAFIALDDSVLCSLAEGLQVTRLIAAAETANATRNWVTVGAI